MLILGAHMSIADGFAAAAYKTGAEFECRALQLFTKSPRSRFSKPLNPVDVELFRKYCEQYNISYVIAHSSYLLNFGKPASSIPWAIENIVNDFERLFTLGGKGIVVHIGKALDGERPLAIHNIIENAKRVIDKTQHTGLEYILENTAGLGTEIGFRFEELAEIWKVLKNFSPRIRSCLDTAHVWAAGYDLTTADSVKKVLKTYDELIGLDTLSCFHFNDSQRQLGDRVDRHANIGDGNIGLEGLTTLAEFAVEKSIPLILETPEKQKTHWDDIVTVRAMLKERES